MEAFDIIKLCLELHLRLFSAKTLQGKHKITAHLLSNVHKLSFC